MNIKCELRSLSTLSGEIKSETNPELSYQQPEEVSVRYCPVTKCCSSLQRAQVQTLAAGSGA